MNNEQSFLSSLNFPTSWGINSTKLTPQQRANVEESIKSNAKKSSDYVYAHRNNAIMTVALQDMVDNSNTGVWVSLAAVVAGEAYLNSCGILKNLSSRPFSNLLRLPVYVGIIAATNWAWTSGTFHNYSATAAVVNKDIATELNSMMDLKQ